MNGIDVSSYQGRIDWNAARSVVQFAYAKATEGTGYTDDQFMRNHDECKAHGIPFSAYHFFRFGSDPIAQARHFLTTIDGRQGTLLPMVDVEGGGQDGVTDLEQLVTSLSTFLHEVEESLSGQRCVLYTDYGDWNKTPYTDSAGVFHPGFMCGTDAFSGHPLFIAEYNHDAAPTLPNGFSDWVLWQYSSGGTIPGIAGAVDLDRTKADNLTAITRV